ncbi:hypothetical protein GCM10025857_18790 [Alicyclobacillus contaminans]|uniref:sporulation protein YabP n=1 Tax=Alicyclobacillus contaminans TaxID=392016 RepID=UPI0004235002|nr:sporulation protein YabP [Alicyclobacillus contaminans]GMA50522.1 hypothetical protein GCM10025857_18790 [Alicyclobacillus contaminans]
MYVGSLFDLTRGERFYSLLAGAYTGEEDRMDEFGGIRVDGKAAHDLHILGRKSVEVTGVASVESFDTTAFTLITNEGPLSIQGRDLHMKHLDLQSGVVIIEGTVTSLSYIAPKEKKRRLSGALFR